MLDPVVNEKAAFTLRPAKFQARDEAHNLESRIWQCAAWSGL
jgi:hypothetical protein